MDAGFTLVGLEALPRMESTLSPPRVLKLVSPVAIAFILKVSARQRDVPILLNGGSVWGTTETLTLKESQFSQLFTPRGLRIVSRRAYHTVYIISSLRMCSHILISSTHYRR